MTKLYNEIIINASIEKIWNILANVGELDQYDPTIFKSTVTSSQTSGLGSSRKVDMLDGKHWFKEKTTVCRPNEALTYELTECSFPIKSLRHSYSFERSGEQTKVSQEMQYEAKYGLLGQLMDTLMLRKQFDGGIKKFFMGLKRYAEKK
jgi:ribosome-associated toxin RatA of RatAB toxin-antitoxin module